MRYLGAYGQKGCCVIVKGVCERARGKRAIKRGNAHKEAQTRKTDVLGEDVNKIKIDLGVKTEKEEG